MKIVDDGAVDDLREWKRNPELFISNAILRIRRLERRLVQLERRLVQLENQVQHGQTHREGTQADSPEELCAIGWTISN
jgi:hypothetical protein